MADHRIGISLRTGFHWSVLALVLGVLALLPGEVAASPAPAPAQANLSAYREASFAAVLSALDPQQKAALADAQQAAPERRVTRYRLLVTYTGETRRMGPGTRTLVQSWGDAHRDVPKDFLDLFRREIEVLAEGKTYWMPARAQLMPFIDTEMKAGDPLYLYVLFIGVSDGQPQFLVNEFNKPRLQ